MELITNGSIVSDALQYVNGKAKKLARRSGISEMSISYDEQEEEDLKDYQTTTTSETEETTTNCTSSDS